CHDLVYKLNKKIIYDPAVLVYNNRRGNFRDPRSQISRNRFQRGRFARLFPKTSCRLGYFLPSVFFLSLIAGPFFTTVFEFFSLSFLSLPLFSCYLLFTICYLLILFFTGLGVWRKEKSFFVGLLFIPAVLLTHLVYGAAFIEGLASPLSLFRFRGQSLKRG
ncbi:MAG: hypothetical protein Q8N98_04485, partial [bacterium]|nr:hypothetical protein [bacterium]